MSVHLTVEVRPLMTNDAVDAAIANGEVDASVARTIASWWMSPHSEFSRFAHTGECEPFWLMAEIESEPTDDYLIVLAVWIMAETDGNF